LNILIKNSTLHLALSLAIAGGVTACGEKSPSLDPAAGIVDDTQSSQEESSQTISSDKAPDTVESPIAPPLPTVPLSLADSLPVNLGSSTYTTESALVSGITEQARSLLYNAAKTNWLVSADFTSLDSVFSNQSVFIDVRSINNSSDKKTTRPNPSVAKQWLIEDPSLDQGTQWSLNITVKVHLLNQSKVEEHCALMKSQKIISPKKDTLIVIRDFSFSVTTGSCASIPTETAKETITELSAKTKIAPGDSKQTVAVVMGTTGLQVISPQLWCWVGSKVSNGCGYRFYYLFNESSTNPSCDCEVRFNNSGAVSSQKGLSGTVLDLTRW
jgi:hypothetical protein